MAIYSSRLIAGSQSLLTCCYQKRNKQHVKEVVWPFIEGTGRWDISLKSTTCEKNWGDVDDATQISKRDRQQQRPRSRRRCKRHCKNKMLIVPVSTHTMNGRQDFMIKVFIGYISKTCEAKNGYLFSDGGHHRRSIDSLYLPCDNHRAGLIHQMSANNMRTDDAEIDSFFLFARPPRHVKRILHRLLRTCL